TDAFAPEAPFTLMPPDGANLLRHTPFRRHEAGSVELWPLEPKDEAEPAEPWTAPKGQESAASPKAKLARRIAQYIKREIDRGAAIWDRNEQRPARPGDFLILVRGRTGGLFDGILQALKRENLPVAGADRIQLLESLAVQDLLNLVRFALCPEDDLVVAEILKGPFGGLDDDQLFALAHGRRTSLWQAVLAAKASHVAPVREFLIDAFKRRFQPPFEFLTHALERSQGAEKPGWEKILARFGGPAREPVTALIDRAAAWDADHPPSLQLFLDAIERRGGEVKRELSGPQGEVRVMTVHGAKGLEAPIVILPDTCSSYRADTDGVFLNGDGAPLWAGPKTNDTELSAQLRAVADARALREHRRLLYVALTRAQDRLVVCGSFSGHAKGAGFAETSWYSVCSAAMNRLGDKVEQLVDGDRTLQRFGAPTDLMLPALVPGGELARLPAWIGKPAPAETSRPVLSPSQLVDAHEPPVISPFDDKRAARLRRGNLIHLLFEVLPDIAPKQRRPAAERFLSAQADLSPEQRKEMLDAAFRVLDDPRFAQVFRPGGRAEAPVVGKIGGVTINGRVDRLVITDTEILIVDYKTDRPAPPSVEAVGEAYVAQMAAYRAVLSQLWPNRPIRCLLVWTDGPQLMEIPPSLLDSALKRVRA
ncbi:MAG TPA: 3'-5' exonuclease, partial [Hyphomonadaceae bacterium]|nr:3'-5' exonuclease [Hyphomonadaceae bacterium]